MLRASFTLGLLYNMSMARTAGLSVCIATHNESRNIRRCLESVISWADEVIIIDGKSSDDTVAIAKSFGKKVKVFSEDNHAMFHINKQKAIDKASGQWILQLDGDEEVTDDLKREVTQVVGAQSATGDTEPLSGYWIPRLNYFLGRPLRKGGQYPDHTIRLYKNGAAKFPCKSIHEQVKVSGEVGYLKHPMNHFPYHSFTDYINKWDRYCDLEAQLLFDQNVKPGIGLFLQYFLIKPKMWFAMTYFRHKAFMDGFPGYVFALFSSLRFLLIYVKLYEKNRT